MKKSSPVWDSFEKINDKQVKCKFCLDVLSYRGGTSSMLSHLQSKHPSITQTQPLNCSSTRSVGQPISNEGRAKQSTMANFVTLQKRCSPGWAETIISLIMKMVALDMMPVYTVEGKGFRQLMEFVEPEYKLPSHQTIMRRVNKMYGEIKRAVMDDVVDVKDVAITTGVWKHGLLWQMNHT